MPAHLALRIDDIGASSKRYEIYSQKVWRWRRFKIDGNWLFLKYLPPYRAWGIYREMRANEWQRVLRLLETYHAKLTVAVTATWAENHDRLIPFPQKFPDEAASLKEGVEAGLIEIANHGLTHCVLTDNAFKPKWFASNRTQHREFWDWLPPETHYRHLQQSQAILQNYFGVAIETLVPPGNVFSDVTLQAAYEAGLRYVSCQTTPQISHDMLILGNEHVLPFHDRELVLDGIGWLESQLKQHNGKKFCFIRELAEINRPSSPLHE